MAQTIKLKRSASQGAVPSLSSLELGEIAINTNDGAIYIKRDDGSSPLDILAVHHEPTMHIDYTNNRIGIGTTSPSSDLHIASSLATIRLEDSDVAGGTAYSLITGSSAGNLAFSADPDNVRSTSDIRFNIDGTERLRINSSGDVTINSSGTIPTGVLLGRQLVVGSATGSEIIAFREDTDVNVGDISGALLIGNSDIDGVEDHFVGMWGKVSSTNGSQDLHFAAGRSGYEGDIPQMTLDSAGNLLVGGTTAATKVTLDKTGFLGSPTLGSAIDSTFTIDVRGNLSTDIVAGEFLGGYLLDAYDASAATGAGVSRFNGMHFVAGGNFGPSASEVDLVFATGLDGNATEKMRIYSSGNATFVGAISSGAITSSEKIVSTKAQHTSATSTNAHFRVLPSTVTDTTGLSSLFLGTSTLDGYGVSLNGARKGTDGTPGFTLRMHNNSVNGSEVFTIANDGNVNFSGTIDSGAITSSGKVTGTWAEFTATDATDPGTDDLNVSGYGIVGNRAGNPVYIHNLGAGGVRLSSNTALGNETGAQINDTSSTFFGDVTIEGDLFVTGATTSVNVEDLNVEQGEITLNYSATADTSASAGGSGIRIQDAVDASNDATILWDATNDEFDFSHGATFAGTVSSGSISAPSITTTTGSHFKTNTNANPLQISRVGSTGSEVLNIGITDTQAVFNYIEDTSSEGAGNYGTYVFQVSGNSSPTGPVTVLTLNEVTATFNESITAIKSGSGTKTRLRIQGGLNGFDLNKTQQSSDYAHLRPINDGSPVVLRLMPKTSNNFAYLELWNSDFEADINNFSRAMLYYDTSNNFYIQTNASGTGTAGNIILRTNSTPALTLDTSQNATFAGTISNSQFTIPNTAGLSGQALLWPGSGTILAWGNPVTAPAGNSGEVQYNNGGTTGAANFLLVNDTTDVLTVNGDIVVTGTVDGRDIATDGTKLDGIESNATADQTQADINALAITEVGTISSGTWAATDVAVSHGGTGASDAATARTNLGLAIGTNVQAYNATLAAVAGGTYTGDDSITTVGTIGTGTWNASVIASQYLDADTAHLSGAQTFDGAKTFSGGLVASGGISGLTLTNGISGTNFNITGVNQLEIADPGEGIVFKSGASGDMTLAIVDDTADNILRYSGTNAVFDVQGNITLTGVLHGPGTFYIDPSPDDTGSPGGATTDTGTVVILGDLQVTGTTTTVNSTTVNIGDNIIVLNSGETGSPTQNAGIEIERGTGTNTLLRYNETNDRWEFTNDGSTYHNIATGVEDGATADQTQADINALAITQVGTITSGTWEGTAIASAYLDSDTAHLSGNQTFTGTKTFSGVPILIASGTTSRQTNDLLYIGGTGLDGTDAAIYLGNHGGGSGYGWRFYYTGSGNTNDNKLIIRSENLGSPVDALSFTQDGAATFSSNVIVSGAITLSGLSAQASEATALMIDGSNVVGTRELGTGAFATAYSHPNHTGDVTSTGDGATVIANDAVINAKLANMAVNTIKGRATAGTGDPEDLTAAQVRTILNVANGANNYSLPEATSTVRGGIELFSDTDQSVAANTVSTTTGRTYGLQLNADGQGVVNVPWTDTVYSLPEATATTRGGIELFSNTDQSVAANTVSTTAGRTYGLQLNANGQGVVNVPWTDTGTNLGNTASGTALTVTSSTGNNTNLPAATTSAWGVMTDEDKTKLDGIDTGATKNFPQTSFSTTTSSANLAILTWQDEGFVNCTLSNGTYWFHIKASDVYGLISVDTNFNDTNDPSFNVDAISVLKDASASPTVYELVLSVYRNDTWTLTVNEDTSSTVTTYTSPSSATTPGTGIAYVNSWNCNYSPNETDHSLNVIADAFFKGKIKADTINTGQGDHNLFAMNQDVESTDDVTFASLKIKSGSTIDPDFQASSLTTGLGVIADGGGWSANGLFMHSGTVGQSAAIGVTTSGLYFGVQDGSNANSLSTWLNVDWDKTANFTGDVELTTNGKAVKVNNTPGTWSMYTDTAGDLIFDFA